MPAAASTSAAAARMSCPGLLEAGGTARPAASRNSLGDAAPLLCADRRCNSLRASFAAHALFSLTRAPCSRGLPSASAISDSTSHAAATIWRVSSADSRSDAGIIGLCPEGRLTRGLGSVDRTGDGSKPCKPATVVVLD
eukprot:363941-Chlamydomonas_euryale.AAC.2